MQLATLIRSLDVIESRGAMDIDIEDISYHSHQVKQGDLFVAIPGTKRDGHHYIQESIAHGAQAVIAEHLPVEPLDVPVIAVADAREALAQISAEFYSHPSHELTLVGITGTNGKTTTSYESSQSSRQRGGQRG